MRDAVVSMARFVNAKPDDPKPFVEGASQHIQRIELFQAQLTVHDGRLHTLRDKYQQYLKAHATR